jgi:DNA-directed RNA polymerase subunit H (RpoH/RPB5)
MNNTKIFNDLVHLRKYTILDPQKRLVMDPKRQTRIQIFLCEGDKLDMNYFYRAYEQLEPGVTHLIFIYTIATIQIKKLKTYKDIFKIEFFKESECRRLLIGNRLIPKHVQVDPETRTQIIQRYGQDNLPIILNTDPIVRLYDFDTDSILQIERPDVLYYRLVVADDSGC